MVRSKGFEPLTFWFVAKHSIQLSYERMTVTNYSQVIKKLVAPAGIEPATQGFSVPCSTDWAMKPKIMAVSTGLEPAIFCVTGRRVNQLHQGTNGCGKRIRTSDLRVMSPTSYQTAPSRDINGGGKGIRTPAPLARPPGFQDRSLQPDLGIPPRGAWGRTWTGTRVDSRRILSPVRLPIPPLRHMVTFMRFELMTLWLKVKCSTNWANRS